MTVIKFKPESYQYFGNSKVFYVTGVALDTVVQDDQVVIRKNSTCQLYFTSNTPNFDKDKLDACQIIRPRIDNFVRDCRVKGRRGFRLTVNSFDENDIWFHC